MVGTTDRDAGRTGPKDVRFRGYAVGDLSACARLARDAWPAGPGTASKELELAGMEGYMQYSLDSSNWSDIAYADEGMVGFLFGRIDGLPGAPVPDHGMLGELPSLLSSILNHDRRDPRMLAFLLSLALTEFKLRLNTPDSDASVEMFIVDSGWRGKGVGTTLLERFLAAAKGAGCRLVTLYTDELMSNWFRKVATFHDNITSHYSGLPAVGIVFAKDILERDGA